MPLHCPCGSVRLYIECCKEYLTGKADAPTPEKLMRSRYTAFVKQKFAYLSKTMQGEALQAFDIEEARRAAPFIKWLKLEVMHAETHGNQGIVEFKAHYTFKKQRTFLHEISQFERIDEQWFYVGSREKYAFKHFHETIDT